MDAIEITASSKIECTNDEVVINQITVLGSEIIEKIIAEYTDGYCPVCFSEQFSDGDIICDKCYEKARESREKYR